MKKTAGLDWMLRTSVPDESDGLGVVEKMDLQKDGELAVCHLLRPGPRPRYGRLATRALLRGSRARHLLSSNARIAVAGSGASRSRPTSSRSQSKTPYPAA